jgi:hypothetical protein
MVKREKVGKLKIELNSWVSWLPFAPHLRDMKSGKMWHPFHNMCRAHMMHMKMKDVEPKILVELRTVHLIGAEGSGREHARAVVEVARGGRGCKGW